MQIKHFYREHRWEIILGLVFAVLFGIVWEGGKLIVEHTEHVEPERLAAGTLRVAVLFNLTTDAQRKIVAEKEKEFHLLIITKDFVLAKMGSGFAVDDQGWIVTARHVINTKPLEPLMNELGTQPFIAIAYPPDAEDRRATVVAEDRKTDTAILKVVNPLPARYLVLGDPDDVHRLDRVVAAGYPSAGDINDPREPTMTGGAISKVSREGSFGRTFDITAPIGPGNSGGPLFDAEGRVIGINVAIPAEKNESVIAFSVAIDSAKALLAKRNVELPESYEHQGLRHPWVIWAGVILLVVWLVYAVIAWRSRLRDVRTPSAAALIALLIDAAVVIPLWIVFVALLIWFFNVYWLSYAMLLAIPLLWLAHAKCSLGKRIARSLWGKILFTPLALLVLLLGTVIPLGTLQERAAADVDRLHALIWKPSKLKMPADLMARERDRMAFLRFSFRPTMRRDALYLHGLDLMRTGSSREAIHAFEGVIGRPWETLGPGTGLTFTTTDEDAAVKAGWCYLDLGNSARAKQMFDILVGDQTTEADQLIGLGVALQRLGDVKGSRALCVRAKAHMRRPLEDYTPWQMRAVQQFLAQCP